MHDWPCSCLRRAASGDSLGELGNRTCSGRTFNPMTVDVLARPTWTAQSHPGRTRGGNGERAMAAARWVGRGCRTRAVGAFSSLDRRAVGRRQVPTWAGATPAETTRTSRTPRRRAAASLVPACTRARHRYQFSPGRGAPRLSGGAIPSVCVVRRNERVCLAPRCRELGGPTELFVSRAVGRAPVGGRMV